MGKRGSEGQLTKDDYEDQLERPQEQLTAPGSFQRANPAELQRRRIIRSNRPIAAPPSLAQETTTAAASSNPFGAVSLKAAPAPAAAAANAPPPSNEYVKAGNLLFNSFNMAWNSAPVGCDAISHATQYLWLSLQQSADYARVFGGASEPPFDASLNAPAPEPAPPAANPPAASLGSFAPAAPAAAAANPSASAFVAPSAFTEQAAAAAAPPNNDNDHGNEEVLTTQDKDWNHVAQFENVRFYRLKDTKQPNAGWTPFVEGGKLVLQRDKLDATVTRMVVRNPAGLKVLVNMALKGVSFKCTETQTKKGTKQVQIAFGGTNDLDRGHESFTIRVKREIGHVLHQKLVELASG